MPTAWPYGIILAILSLQPQEETAPASKALEPEWGGWNQFRGPNRDGLSKDTGLLKEWSAQGPPLAWTAQGLGAGYSGVSFAENLIFTLGDEGDTCNLHALDRSDGKRVWSTGVGPAGGHAKVPGPRSTPATDGRAVFALGQHGDLVAVRVTDGREVWRKSLMKDFGGGVPHFSYSESPLLDGDIVVCTPGGPGGSLVALKTDTGEKVWQSEEVKDPAQYASLVPADFGGVRQYLLVTLQSVAGIGAKDGKLLWRVDRNEGRDVVATPVYRDRLVFVAGGYEAGCGAFQITPADSRFPVDKVYSGRQMENHYGGVILVGDHLYGTDKSSLKCIELMTGTVVWQDRSVGRGSVAYADGHLVVRGERGSIALVEANPSGYKEKGRFLPPHEQNNRCWTPPTLHGGRLYVREQDALYCYDVRAR